MLAGFLDVDPVYGMLFARYCERATRYLGDLIGGACTVNEPNIALLLTKSGLMPPPDPLHPAPWERAVSRLF